MSKPYCIAFAAPVGAGKSQIAYHLSWSLGLGILNNDAIRAEVQAEHVEFLGHDPEEYFHRRDERIRSVFSLQRPFIYDASVDRRWSEFESRARDAGYDILLVSLDWSRAQWDAMLRHKGYNPHSEQCNTWFTQHQDFTTHHLESITISLNDNYFNNRMDYVVEEIIKVLKNRER